MPSNSKVSPSLLVESLEPKAAAAKAFAPPGTIVHCDDSTNAANNAKKYLEKETQGLLKQRGVESTHWLIAGNRTVSKRQRHPATPSEPVELRFNWSIFNIDKVDVVQATYEIDIKFVLEWDIPDVVPPSLLGALPEGPDTRSAPGESSAAGGADNAKKEVNVWRPRLVVVNKTDKMVEKFSATREESGGLVGHQRYSMRWRVTGVLNEVFSLQTFPFDQQWLRVVVRALDDICVVRRLRAGIAGRQPVYQNMPLTEYTQFEHEELARSHLTDPKNSTKGSVYAQMEVFVVVRRKWLYHTTVLLIPVFTLTLLGVATFEIDIDESMGERVGNQITLLLTMVSLKFAMGGMLPKLPYLTFLDMYIMGAFFFVAFLTGENYLVAKFDADPFVDQVFEVFWLLAWLSYTLGFALWAVWITKSHKAGQEVTLGGWSST